ncbi:hypothetical protein LEP1GSC127_0225 [Leptospira kirschneri str. 200801925]|nr:hypothetical protein LEP1GSC127_0225 [Leptospira kirschneri str. 200801925]
MSEYATSNFAEDKGDIGAAIQGRQFSYLNEICAVDPIIAAKVRLTIDEMNRFAFLALSGSGKHSLETEILRDSM